MGTTSAAERSLGTPDRVTEEEACARAASVDAARGILNQRLMDSLVHDVRNPLNALSINLDVLMEKLRRELGEIPATQEKNLRVMREQIFRVDGILKHFAEYLGPPRGPAAGQVDLSAVLGQVVALLAHETRRGMIKVRQLVEPGVVVRGTLEDARFVMLQALYRAVARAGSEGEVDLTLQRDGGRALLRIRDGSADAAAEPFVHALPALTAVTHKLSAELRLGGSETLITFPLL